MQRRGGERVPDFQLLRSEALFILWFLVPSACYGSGYGAVLAPLDLNSDAILQGVFLVRTPKTS